MSRADQDPADRALAALIVEIEDVRQQLADAGQRAVRLQQLRARDQSWSDIVTAEDRPLIVERISGARASLMAAGGRWRREEAAALHAEGLSISRVAALFGVTRQRISTILREHLEETDPPEGASTTTALPPSSS